MPTLAELAGTTAATSDGLSFVDALLGRADAQAAHPYLYWENGSAEPHVQSVRLGDTWWACRPHPDKPVALYAIEEDVPCAHDVAAAHPEVVRQVLEIFATAHEDSAWYRNPGESDAVFEAKTKRARESGQLQMPTPPNGMPLNQHTR